MLSFPPTTVWNDKVHSNFEVTLRRTLIEGDLNVAPQLRIDLQVARSKAAKTFVVLVAVSNCKKV